MGKHRHKNKSGKGRNKNREHQHISPQQQAANQQNAQLSTGPQTVQGKVNASRNAITHGAYTGKILLSWEEVPKFHAFYTVLWLELNPQSPLEELHADEYIWYSWKLRRMRTYEAQLPDTIRDGVLLQQERDKVTLIETRLTRLRDKAEVKLKAAREAKAGQPEKEEPQLMSLMVIPARPVNPETGETAQPTEGVPTSANEWGGTEGVPASVSEWGGEETAGTVAPETPAKMPQSDAPAESPNKGGSENDNDRGGKAPSQAANNPSPMKQMGSFREFDIRDLLPPDDPRRQGTF